jgi:hypothetical protein
MKKFFSSKISGRVVTHARSDDSTARADLEATMATLSRRLFMKRSGMTVAAAAVVGSGLPSILSSGAGEAPEVEGDASATAVESTAGSASAGAANMSQPVLAQVKNVSTGEISIYSGEQEITYLDPEMAARLVRAAAATP